MVGCRAVLMAMLGRYDEARSQMAEASAGLAELQLRGIALYVSLLESVAEMLAGDPAAAERAVRGAEASALESGDRWYQALVHVDLTHAVLAQEAGPTPRRRSRGSRRWPRRATSSGRSSATPRGR